MGPPAAPPTARRLARLAAAAPAASGGAAISHLRAPRPRFWTVAALLATRTDAELSDLYSTMPCMDGIDFYSSNTLRQIVRHLLLKVRVGLTRGARCVRVCACVRAEREDI